MLIFKFHFKLIHVFFTILKLLKFTIKIPCLKLIQKLINLKIQYFKNHIIFKFLNFFKLKFQFIAHF